jgi:beta-xylosidase
LNIFSAVLVSRNAFQERPAFFSSSFVREVTNEVAMDDDSCVSATVMKDIYR